MTIDDSNNFSENKEIELKIARKITRTLTIHFQGIFDVMCLILKITSLERRRARLFYENTLIAEDSRNFQDKSQNEDEN